MQHFQEAKELWVSLVPKTGQADTIQGELMRAVERLRWESHNNGNGNWDAGFDSFCDYLEQTLISSTAFAEIQREEIKRDITRLRDAQHPYLEDDLYDRIEDRIVEFHLHVGAPIPRNFNPQQLR